MSARPKSSGLMRLVVVAALLAPMLAFVAGFATRVGLIDWRTGYESLILVWGWRLAWVSAAAAILTAVLALRDLRERWLAAVVAVVAAGACLGLHLAHRQALSAHPPVHEAASDWHEPLTFSRRTLSARSAVNAAPLAETALAACEGAASVPRQVPPHEAEAALRKAGFTIVGVSPFRVEAIRHGFWLGFTHDVVLRIRPGRTDVRVSGREARADGGQACRLATTIISALATPAG